MRKRLLWYCYVLNKAYDMILMTVVGGRTRMASRPSPGEPRFVEKWSSGMRGVAGTAGAGVDACAVVFEVGERQGVCD